MPFLVIRILEYKHNENTSYSFVLLSKIKKGLYPYADTIPFFVYQSRKRDSNPRLAHYE